MNPTRPVPGSLWTLIPRSGGIYLHSPIITLNEGGWKYVYDTQTETGLTEDSPVFVVAVTRGGFQPLSSRTAFLNDNVAVYLLCPEAIGWCPSAQLGELLETGASQ